MSDNSTRGYEFAIVSFILSLFTFIHFGTLEKPIIGIVLGILALRRFQGTPPKKYKLYAILGIVIGSLGIIFVMTLRVHLASQGKLP